MSHRAAAQRHSDYSAHNDNDTAWIRLNKEMTVSSSSEILKNAVTALTTYASGSIQEAKVMVDLA